MDNSLIVTYTMPLVAIFTTYVTFEIPDGNRPTLCLDFDEWVRLGRPGFLKISPTPFVPNMWEVINGRGNNE